MRKIDVTLIYFTSMPSHVKVINWMMIKTKATTAISEGNL